MQMQEIMFGMVNADAGDDVRNGEFDEEVVQ